MQCLAKERQVDALEQNRHGHKIFQLVDGWIGEVTADFQDLG
jgi:hypothetical protein